MLTGIALQWQHPCPKCGSFTYYVVSGKRSYNPEKTWKRGTRTPMHKGFRCRKCKTLFGSKGEIYN